LAKSHSATWLALVAVTSDRVCLFVYGLKPPRLPPVNNCGKSQQNLMRTSHLRGSWSEEQMGG